MTILRLCTFCGQRDEAAHETCTSAEYNREVELLARNQQNYWTDELKKMASFEAHFTGQFINQALQGHLERPAESIRAKRKSAAKDLYVRK